MGNLGQMRPLSQQCGQDSNYSGRVEMTISPVAGTPTEAPPNLWWNRPHPHSFAAPPCGCPVLTAPTHPNSRADGAHQLCPGPGLGAVSEGAVSRWAGMGEGRSRKSIDDPSALATPHSAASAASWFVSHPCPLHWISSPVVLYQSGGPDVPSLTAVGSYPWVRQQAFTPPWCEALSQYLPEILFWS